MEWALSDLTAGHSPTPGTLLWPKTPEAGCSVLPVQGDLQWVRWGRSPRDSLRREGVWSWVSPEEGRLPSVQKLYFRYLHVIRCLQGWETAVVPKRGSSGVGWSRGREQPPDSEVTVPSSTSAVGETQGWRELLGVDWNLLEGHAWRPLHSLQQWARRRPHGKRTNEVLPNWTENRRQKHPLLPTPAPILTQTPKLFSSSRSQGARGGGAWRDGGQRV